MVQGARAPRTSLTYFRAAVNSTWLELYANYPTRGQQWRRVLINLRVQGRGLVMDVSNLSRKVLIALRSRRRARRMRVC